MIRLLTNITKSVVLFVVLLTGGVKVYAQELNCQVIVNADKVPGSNKKIYKTLQTSLTEFMNHNRWGDHEYKANEKIDCTLLITIDEVGADEKTFSATLQVQARRPVFGSSYYSPIINFRDENFNFEYIEMQPLDYVENQFTDNLTSLLAYYAYLIIGYDEDTYSELGGTSMFQKAEALVNLAQGRGGKGWKAFEDTRNRYALINNLNDENLKPFRRGLYQYHRLGLDMMNGAVDKGLLGISDCLKGVQQSNKMRSSCVAISTWLETKRDEVTNIYSKASGEQKKAAYTIMVEVDPSQSDKYEEILK